MSRFPSSSFSYSSAHYHYNEEGIPVHKEDYKAPENRKKENKPSSNERPKTALS